ncbi:hypothetical protein HBI56_203430 [Parastagonospora nodorum]|nr:hypothetical protein HBI10_138370 [Parastagonospora nodorum]KAH4020371.1 hypothetical protein HBI13_114070 [Parastagonospora nodorum]KAH4031517.1 hypothetical protein HBI09_125710 [Parastagonospora nodorum]KAH4065186.1 hypothetical protein HBH50_163130 [Parastagonospora nodorum]KAH4084585.1 hypothetical protein HBH48_160860 [Parastagonospora nodorum]
MDPRDGITKLVVGNEAENVHVHQGLLCRSSEFFKRAMKPEWASLREDPNTIQLLEDSTKMVVFYVQWLYREELVLDVPHPAKEDDAYRAAKSDILYTRLAEAYVFGEKIMDVTYKNQVLRKFVAVQRNFYYSPGPTPVSIIYAGTPSGSRMRLLICDFIAYSASGDASWVTHFDGYPHETLVEAIKLMSTLRESPEDRPYKADIKKYIEEEEARVIQDSRFVDDEADSWKVFQLTNGKY